MNFIARAVRCRHKRQVIYSLFTKACFTAVKKINFFFFPVGKKKILFSIEPEWEKKIRSGFRFTKHELYFDNFTPENISGKDVVVPLTMQDLQILNQNRRLIVNTPIPVPGPEAIRICNDKYLFTQALTEAGFGRFIPRTGTNLPLPFVLKKRTSAYGRDCYIIANDTDLAVCKALLNDTGYFCQEVISGKYEFATHILFKDNGIKASLTVRYEYPSATAINGRDKFIARSISQCKYLSLFASMLSSIGFEGLCCFDYKVINNQPYIFEINPRFGGSLCRYFFSFINKNALLTAYERACVPGTNFKQAKVDFEVSADA